MMIILIIIATNIVIIISGTHSTFYHPFIHLIKHLAASFRKTLKNLKIGVSKFLTTNTLYFVKIEFWRRYFGTTLILWIFLTVTDRSAWASLARAAEWKTIRSNFCRGMHRGPSIKQTPEIIGKHFYFSVNYNIKKLPWLMPLVLWNYNFSQVFIVCDWKYFCCVVQNN